MLACCEREGLVFLPWQPVAATDQGARAELAAVAETHGASSQQVALAWLLAHSPAMAPIPGTSDIAHLDDNVDAAWLSLTEDETASLDAALAG